MRIVMSTAVPFLLMLVLTTLMFGCEITASREENQVIGENSPAQQVTITDSSSEQNLNLERADTQKVLLEIWEDVDGSTPIRGRSLYFRFFDDKIAEFDFLVRKPSQNPQFKFEFSMENSKLFNLSSDANDQIKTLLEEILEDRSLKKKYKGVALTLDVTTILTISVKDTSSGNDKNLIIEDGANDILYERYVKSYPTKLTNLIKVIREVRDEKIKSLS